MSDDNGKRSGRVEPKDYLAIEFLTKLQPLIAQLNEDIPEAKYDARGLATIIPQILQFQEDALGLNSLVGSRVFPKLPPRLFEDVSEDGALHAIATKLYSIRKSRDLKAFEWMNPGKRKENLEILAGVRRELVNRGFLHIPTVFIHPNCGVDCQRLRAAVNKLQGKLVETEDTPGITHIVYTFGPKGDPDDGVKYMRTQELRASSAKVHHWYLPDSYDEWLPSSVAPEDVTPDKPPRGPYKVYLRWLLDSEKYNEWMNPSDYETEEFTAEQEQLEQAAQAGKLPGGVTGAAGAADAAASQVKRKREEGEGDEGDGVLMLGGDEQAAKKLRPQPEAPRPEVDATAAQRIGVNVVKHKVVEPYKHAMDGSASVENISQGQLEPHHIPPGAAHPPVPAAEPPPNLGPTPTPPAPPVIKKELYVVPAHASWFSWNKIQELERRGVPDFFNGRSTSKTPKVYKEYRDFIINKYRENPARRLTFTEVRKHLAGDVNGILRVWEFLDSWGLINFMARDGPGEISAPDAAPLLPDGFKLITSTLTPGENGLFHFSAPKPAEAARAAGTGGGLNLVTHKDPLTKRVASEASTSKSQYYCNAMPWVDCTELRYHCTKYPDVDLCPQAFAEGRFPPGCSAKDFVRIDAKDQKEDATGWTPQETLLLLEALELYGDNWSEVAAHVGTKSQVACVMHFLQLPIEDQFIDTMEGTNTTAAAAAAGAAPSTAAAAAAPSSAGASTAAVADGDVAELFADAGNPVMAQVAFLSMLVGPKVAAAAAQRALEVLAEDDPGVARDLADVQAAAAAEAAPSTPDISSDAGRQQQQQQPEAGDAGAGVIGKQGGGGDAMEVDEGGKPAGGGVDNAANGAAGVEVDKAADQASGKGLDTSAAAVKAATVPQKPAESVVAIAQRPINATAMKVAAAAALAAAAVRAKLLAEQEEREIQRLVVGVVDAQMKKIEAKLKYMEELDQALGSERAQLESTRRQLEVERLQYHEARMKAAATPSPAIPVLPAAATFMAAPNVPSSTPNTMQGTTAAATMPVTNMPQQMPAAATAVSGQATAQVPAAVAGIPGSVATAPASMPQAAAAVPVGAAMPVPVATAPAAAQQPGAVTQHTAAPASAAALQAAGLPVADGAGPNTQPGGMALPSLPPSSLPSSTMQGP